jgi:microsomal dipeptidase-like Zn-dependent dipeptidase
MADQMIKDPASKSGVIQINYEKTYLDQAYREAYETVVGNIFTGTGDIAKACGGDIDCYWRENLQMEASLTKEGKLPAVSWERISEHIDHVMKLVGPTSGWDPISTAPACPRGWKTARSYPESLRRSCARATAKTTSAKFRAATYCVSWGKTSAMRQ